MGVIDEVKQRIDIIEVVSQYATLKKAGRNLTALCPFHQEKNPSFFVYPEQQSWHCFGACNTGGDVFSFIMKKENIDFGEALRLLGQRAGVTIPSRFEPDTKKDEKERLYQVNEAAAWYFNDLLMNSPAAKKARDYLANRGLSQETIAEFQLGYGLNSWEELKKYLLEKGFTQDEILEAGLVVASDDGETHDRFRNRLIFPINDNRGRTTGFGARVLDDSLPKYVNSPQTPVFDKSGTIYAIDRAAPAIRQQNLAVIVEGYMDVITAHQNGFKNVVAAMGTAITERQVSMLKRVNSNITLALDADSAGEEAMLRCVDYENILDAEIRVVVLPEGKDPDDVVKEDSQAWQRLLDEALPVVDYTIDMVCSRLDLTKAGDKSSAVNTLLPIISKIKDNTRQDHYLTRLSSLTGTSYRRLEATLGSIKPARKARQPESREMTRAIKPLVSSRTEEECLALLLQHPELKNIDADLKPDYFESSENREIFTAWRQADAPLSLKDTLDNALWEYYDALVNREILATKLDERYNKYVLRLQEDYLRSLARKRAAASEPEGKAAGLPKEEDIEVTSSLREVFSKKSRRGGEQRR
ncbi:DNA primase [Chloroflexota bacterium]